MPAKDVHLDTGDCCLVPLISRQLIHFLVYNRDDVLQIAVHHLSAAIRKLKQLEEKGTYLRMSGHSALHPPLKSKERDHCSSSRINISPLLEHNNAKEKKMEVQGKYQLGLISQSLKGLEAPDALDEAHCRCLLRGDRMSTDRMSTDRIEHRAPDTSIKQM